MFFFLLSLFACANNGADDSADSSSMDWRPEHTVQLDCPWISQNPSATSSTYNCGPTSMVMAVACIDGTTPTYGDVLNTIIWMDENIGAYGGVGTDGNGSLTNTVELAEVANNYFKISAETFGLSDGVLSLEDMYYDLDRGIPIVLAVRYQGDNTTDVMEYTSGHYMVLTGMTSTHIVVNDPGPFDEELGKNHAYTIESFLDTWQNAGIELFPV